MTRIALVWLDEAGELHRKASSGDKVKSAISVPGPALNMPRDYPLLQLQYIRPRIGIDGSVDKLFSHGSSCWLMPAMRMSAVINTAPTISHPHVEIS